MKLSTSLNTWREDLNGNINKNWKSDSFKFKKSFLIKAKNLFFNNKSN